MSQLNKREFKEEFVLDDLKIDEPESLLNVHYGEAREVVTGSVLTPKEVRAQPQVTWEADQEKYYTLTLTDIDWPGREDRRHSEFLCWSLINIPGNFIKSGDVVAEYVAPGPGKDSGLHRVVFLLYMQKGKIPFRRPAISAHSMDGRIRFCTQQFVHDNQLHTPVAGVFFQTRWHEYVEEWEKQLSGQLTKK